jgi:hypothetical protein
MYIILITNVNLCNIVIAICQKPFGVYTNKKKINKNKNKIRFVWV